jgi:hypothetical protein
MQDRPKRPYHRTKLTAAELRARGQARSKITNGKQLLPHVDGRSLWVRRLRDLINLHVTDLGGVDNCSTAERSLIQRASCLTVELEHLESKFATDGAAAPEALQLYSTTANTLRRLLQTVGLQRRARDVTPTLQEYLREAAE